MEPTRLIVAIEVPPDEAEGLYDGIRILLNKSQNVKFNIKLVELRKDGQKDEGTSEKVAGK
jgi:hypothetical protein